MTHPMTIVTLATAPIWLPVLIGLVIAAVILVRVCGLDRPETRV